MLGKKIDDVVERFYEWLGAQPEFNVFFSSQDTVERVKRLQKVYWVDFFNGVVDQRYIDFRVHIGELHAQRDMPNSNLFRCYAALPAAVHGRAHGGASFRPSAVGRQSAPSTSCSRSTPL